MKFRESVWVLRWIWKLWFLFIGSIEQVSLDSLAFVEGLITLVTLWGSGRNNREIFKKPTFDSIQIKWLRADSTSVVIRGSGFLIEWDEHEICISISFTRTNEYRNWTLFHHYWGGTKRQIRIYAKTCKLEFYKIEMFAGIKYRLFASWLPLSVFLFVNFCKEIRSYIYLRFVTKCFLILWRKLFNEELNELKQILQIFVTSQISFLCLSASNVKQSKVSLLFT